MNFKVFILLYVVSPVLSQQKVWSDLCNMPDIHHEVTFNLLLSNEELKEANPKLNFNTTLDDNTDIANESTTVEEIIEVQVHARATVAFKTITVTSLNLTNVDGNQMYTNPPGIEEPMEFHPRDIVSLTNNTQSSTLANIIKKAIIETLPETIESVAKYRAIEEIFYLIDKSKDEIKLSEDHKNVVLVLGNTGAGKSTFIHWIAETDNTLTAVETTDGDYLIVDAQNKISNETIMSQTLFPELVLDNANKTSYYDLPGFSDSRSSSVDIATSFFTSKVIEHADAVKLLLVVNHSSLRRGMDRKDFLLLLKHVIDIIQKIDKYKGSIAMIVTKVENIYRRGNLVEDSTIMKGIVEFLKEVQIVLQKRINVENNSTATSFNGQFYKSAIELIDILLMKDGENYSHIGLFRRPEQEGPVRDIKKLQTEKNYVKSIIDDRLSYTKSNSNDFGSTISDSSKNDINAFVDTVEQNVLNGICKIYYERKVDFDLNLAQITREMPSDDIIINPVETLKTLSKIKEALNIFITQLQSGMTDYSINENINSKTVTDLFIDNQYLKFISSLTHRKPKSVSSFAPTVSRNIYDYFSTFTNAIEIDVKLRTEKCKKQISGDLKKLSLDLIAKFTELEDNSNVILEQLSEELKNKTDILQTFYVNMEDTTKLTNIFSEFNITTPAYLNQDVDYFVTNVLKAQINEVLSYLNESQMWYKYLIVLYKQLSNYDVQKRIDNSLQLGNNFIHKHLSEILQEFCPKCIENYNDVKDLSLNKGKKWHLQRILNLVFEPAKLVCDGNKLKLTGTNIQLSELLSRVCDGTIDVIEVFAVNSIFIDDDLYFTGDNHVALIAPFIEIIGQREIILNGKSGSKVDYRRANDGYYPNLNGDNGETGRTGTNGGSFYVYTNSEISNTNHLTVKSIGGDGSRGQDGGNGGRGRDGTTPYISNPKEYLKIKGMYNNPYYYDCGSFSCDYHRIDGERCTNGGNNGRGGHGGLGGFPGLIKIHNGPRNTDEVRTRRIKGSDGENGNNGEIGNPGYPGQVAHINWKWIRFWDTTKVTYSTMNYCSQGTFFFSPNVDGLKYASPPISKFNTILVDYLNGYSELSSKIVLRECKDLLDELEYVV